MPEPMNIKLARLEEKLDAVAEKIDNLVKCNGNTQARSWEMENKNESLRRLISRSLRLWEAPSGPSFC